MNTYPQAERGRLSTGSAGLAAVLAIGALAAPHVAAAPVHENTSPNQLTMEAAFAVGHVALEHSVSIGGKTVTLTMPQTAAQEHPQHHHHHHKPKSKYDVVPNILKRIAGCESGSNSPSSKPDYKNESPISSASGAWQDLDSTWGGYMGYSRAMYATVHMQNVFNIKLYDKEGTSPWDASKYCWG